jgi:hypothetical protein
MIITLIFHPGGFEVSPERFLRHQKIQNPESGITSKCVYPQNMGRDVKLVMHHVRYIPHGTIHISFSRHDKKRGHNATR